MIGYAIAVEEYGCHQVPVKDVNAAMVWSIFTSDLIAIVHYGGYTSHFIPTLHRPVIWSKVLQ